MSANHVDVLDCAKMQDFLADGRLSRRNGPRMSPLKVIVWGKVNGARRMWWGWGVILNVICFSFF